MNIPLTWMLNSEPMKRQYSGDGRTVENPFLLGGDPSTPPPESKMRPCLPRGQDNINDEILKAMQAFFKLEKIDSETNGPAAQLQVGSVLFLGNKRNSASASPVRRSHR